MKKKQPKPALLPFLLVVWVLVRVGQLPGVVFKALRRRLYFKRGRGRPQSRPIPAYLNYKYGYFFKKILPPNLRIGLIITFIVATLFFYSSFLIEVAHELPSPDKLNEFNGPMTSEIYDKKGRLLYRLYDDKNRRLVKLENLPSYLIQATIAVEDKNFYSHPGVDIEGILRAVVAYSQNRQIQGGSTITQQLIKNTLLTPDRTIKRKLKEIALAFWAERIFTKQKILQMYFNEVAFGGTAWGIAAASQTYFGKPAAELNLAESAFLAGLPASPTTYSPYGTHPELAKQRQKEVLRRMAEDGYITKEEAVAAFEEPLNIQPPVNLIKAPHFVMFVRQTLAQKYGERAVSQGGLKIVTSLDLDLQEMAEKAVAEEINKLTSMGVTNGAAMITDAKTGQILAMVGSKDYWEPSFGNFNVTLSPRQPGSSIKPVTYAAAFKQGYSPGTVLLDNPVTFRNGWEAYTPVNYDGRFHGPVSIRTALGSSYNIPAVKMLAIIGLPEMIKTARDLGITTLNDPDRYGLSLTLGGGEVKLIDMMAAYGTFSQLGTKYDPQPILTITDQSGKVIEDNQNPPGQKVLPESIAFMIANILSDNKARTPAFGPNSLLNIPGHTVAAKTGTTDSKRDNWTFGFNPDYVVGVWVGNNDNSPMSQTLTSGVTGAAPIWNKIMGKLLEGSGDIAFLRPEDITEGIVDGNKDLLVTGQAKKSIVGLGKKKIKDEKDGSEKEAITFTDPFSTYTSP